MAKLTRANVAYDLTISPYKVPISYSGDIVTFVFSSALYKEKFEKSKQENRDKINASLSNRFGFKIINDKLCDLKLYMTIEKRGFLIYKGEKEFICQEDITLNGENLTMPN